MTHQDKTWVLGDLYTFHLSTPEIAILEVESKGQQGPPLHSHRDQEESFYVLDGELEVTRGPSTTLATQGTFVHFPKGTWHTFRNVAHHGSRVLVTITPGTLANMFREIGIADAGEAHDAVRLNQAQQKLISIAERYGLQIAPPS